MRKPRIACLAIFTILGAVSLSSRALATFPGENGEIAYTRYRPIGGAPYSVRTVYPDGSPGQRLGPRRRSIDAEWSPDGSAFALDVVGRDERLVLEDAATGDRTVVVRLRDVPDANYFESIAFGPSGDALVFCVRTGRSRTRLYTIDTDGSSMRAVSDRSDCYADWSSTNRIAATSGSSGDLVRRIVTMDPDGSHRQLAASVSLGSLGFGIAVAPSWSPDGSVIAYASQTDYHSTSQDLYVEAGDGSDQVLLTSTRDRTEYAPVFSPDGATIAFVRSRGSAFDGSRSDLFLMRIDGSGIRRLTDTPKRNELTRSWRSTNA